MASLLNSMWKIVADDSGFVTTVPTFEGGGQALCEFPVAPTNAVMGTWSENGSEFTLSFVWNQEKPITMKGSHENGSGSGIATLGEGPGQTTCGFTMTKL